MKIASIQGPLEVGIDYSRYVQASKMDRALPPFFNPNRPHNIGDWFLTKIVDRLLDFDEMYLVLKGAGPKEWEIVNSECDVLVLRGGNYIQNDWLSNNVGLDVINKAKIPIVMFGAGLQTPPGERPSFSPEEQEILEYISASCACSSLRGYSTAEALEGIGIDNVAVTGCPTVFWSRRPELELRPPGLGRVGFTFRQNLYSSSADLHKAQFSAIEDLTRRSAELQVFLQGEEVVLQRYLQARDWGAEFSGRIQPLPGHQLHRLLKTPLDAGEMAREAHHLFDRHGGPELTNSLLESMFFSWDIGEMLDAYRQVELMVGCRLHGNLLAMANGTPTFWLTYDERTRELVELLDLPSCAVEDYGPHIDLLGQDWGPTLQRYQDCYSEMVRFLDANGLSHKLPEPDIDAEDDELSLPMAAAAR
jgi:polysaccharide pyruvyl transferase WcaK-like protein